MPAKGKARKVENQQLVSPSQQCSNTPVCFGQGFLIKEQCDNIGASLHPVSDLAPADFLTVPSTEIRIEGLALL